MNNIQFDRCLQRIRNGNINGLRPIFDGYYGALKVTAKRILNSDTAADNAASETLFEIVRYARSHNRPHIENVGAYLYAAVTKIAAHMLGNRAASEFETAAALEFDRADGANYEHAFARLDTVDFNIAVMYYLFDCNITEISNTVNVSTADLKSKLDDISARLKKYLIKN